MHFQEKMVHFFLKNEALRSESVKLFFPFCKLKSNNPLKIFMLRWMEKGDMRHIIKLLFCKCIWKTTKYNMSLYRLCGVQFY